MPTSDGSLANALANLNQGRVLQSISQLKEIIRSDPSNAPANFYLSTLYTQMADFDVAERYLRRAMEGGPPQAAYYHQLGLIRYRQKQWRAALTLFNQALEIGARNTAAVVWRSIGDVQLELFDRDAALQAYEAALRIAPDDAQAQLALGQLYLDRGNAELALPQLLSALKLDAKLGAAYLSSARAYRQTGNVQAAIDLLNRAVDMNPADQDSRYALGQALLAAGKVDDGRKELAKYETTRDQVETANRHYKTGMSLIESGRLSDAEKALREAVRLAPSYSPALSALGTVLLDQGSPDKAVGFLKRAVELNPLNASTWFSLGSAYFKVGKPQEALEPARNAIVLDDTDSRYRQLLVAIESKGKK
jgi:tetratricopeptide (TPR) repeat protein